MESFNIGLEIRMKFFSKYEKVRYEVTQEGASLDLKNNEELKRHVFIGLKSSTLLGFYKNLSK
jgi:hypothetical protein